MSAGEPLVEPLVEPAVDAAAGDEKPPSAISVVRRGIAVTPQLKRGLGLTLGFAVLAGMGRVVVPVLVQQVLDHVLSDRAAGSPRPVWPLGLIGGVAVVTTALAQRATNRRLVRVAEESLASLRVVAFRHVHRLSLADLAEEQRGQLVSRVTSDVDTISQFMQWGGLAWVISTAQMMVTLVAMFVYDWRLALVVLGCVVPLIGVLRILQRKLRTAYDVFRIKVGDVAGALGEAVMGAAVIRGYGAEEHSLDSLDATIDARKRADIRAGFVSALIFPMSDLFSVFSISAVLATGYAIGPAGHLSKGTLIAFAFLVSLFLEPVAEFTEIIDQTQLAVSGWRRVLDLIDTPVEVPDPAPEVAQAIPAGAPLIHVEGVSFGYGSGPLVLHDVSFDVRPGSRVALVGATGSGKSTLAKLLARLADPDEGTVRVGGVDLRVADPGSLRSTIVVVPQEVFLFDTTVGENVRFARPSASDEDVRRAFGELGLIDWLDGLPLGVDTPVGERGEQLSVGERQLVALARAHLADPSCLVLDEATSALDPATEVRVSRALERLAAGRTTVTVAHRLSTAARASYVLVLEEGRLVETGTHEELLLAPTGIYAGMYERWLEVAGSSA